MGSISPISSLIEGSGNPASAGPQLDKNEFLELLMAQVNNQNPLEPMDNAEFISQLTQFSSLEQLMLIREATELIAFLGSGLQGTQEIQPLPLPETGSGSGLGGTGGSPEPESDFLPGGSEGAPQDQ